MANNRLHGKTIVALGDSLFHGSKDCKGNTWLEMMARRNEMTLYNYGHNGNTVAVQHTEAQTLPPMCVRYADMADGADYVVILGGANDKRLNVPLGGDNSTDPESFCGALNILIAGVTAKYPKEWRELRDKYEADGITKHSERLNAMIDKYEELATVFQSMVDEAKE